MGFFGFIGKILSGIFEVGKRLLSFVKRVFTGEQTVVEYNPQATMYCYSDNNCNANNYQRDEFRWENDCTDPTNVNNANNQEARRQQYQYMNPMYNQYRVPCTIGANPAYGYGYVNQNNVMTQPMPYHNTMAMTYSQNPYDVRVQNMRHQYSNQELKWKMSPEVLRQINGPSNWTRQTNPSFDYSQLYNTLSQQAPSVKTDDKDDWSSIKWTSDMFSNKTNEETKSDITPLTKPTNDGIVCAFGRKPDNYVGNAI
jgi:hypothetical protein